MMSRSRVRSRLLLGACLSFFAGCSTQGLATEPSPSAPATPGAIRIVDQAQLDELRAGGQYVISPPLGQVGASAGCSSGSVDAACLELVHQELRDSASARGANLVLVLSSIVRQTQPPQLALSGQLYELRIR